MPPLTVTIGDLPSPGFSSGTMLYSMVIDGYFAEGKMQGNTPAGAGGRAVIPLHQPSGIPYKDLHGVEAEVVVLKQ